MLSHSDEQYTDDFAIALCVYSVDALLLKNTIDLLKDFRVSILVIS